MHRACQVSIEYAGVWQVTRDRMYLDAMQQIFQNTTKVLVDQKAGNNLFYLPLDKLMQITNPDVAMPSRKFRRTIGARSASNRPCTAYYRA